MYILVYIIGSFKTYLEPIMQITAKITKWGNSLGLRINQEIADGLKLGPGSKVSLNLDTRKNLLMIQPVKTSSPWPFKEADLIKGMTPDNSHSDLLAEPIGNEISE